MKLAPSKKWRHPLEEQPKLVEKALAGDRSATEELIACYQYLFDRLSSVGLQPADRSDLQMDLKVCFMESVLPALARVDFRGYPAYIEICLINARNGFWRRYYPNQNLMPIDFNQLFISEDSGIDPDTARQIIWDTLDKNPEVIWQSRLCSIEHIPQFAKKLDIEPWVLRKKVVQTMVRAGATTQQMQAVFGRFGVWWLLDDEGRRKLSWIANNKQRRALRLFFEGKSFSGINKEMSDGHGLLHRLMESQRKSSRQLTICEYFQRLDRANLILAVQLAAPVQLRILQECLRGKNLPEIQANMGHAHRSIGHQALMSLKKRLEKELAKRQPSG